MNRHRKSPAGRVDRGRAAVVDLENIAILGGHLLMERQVAHLLEFIDPLVAEMPVRAASGVNVMTGCLGPLCSRGWGLTLVDSCPEAADIALLDAAWDMLDRRVSDLVVVSGDHAFAELASVARLHVISHPSKLSAVLRRAASTVTYLPSPINPAAAALAA
jgi:hypothetical protein